MATSVEDVQRPVVLTIAGSDNSAGAGLQADLKTFGQFGCYGLTAVTCVVAEVPGKVAALQPVRRDVIERQIALCFDAFPVAAAKTGLLFSTTIVRAVAGALANAKAPLVVDPVMVASSGDALLQSSAVRAYTQALFPLATVVTPNLNELEILAGRGIRTLRAMRDAGRELAGQYGCAFLLKGGHLKGHSAIDILVTSKGFDTFEAPFVRNVKTHGTGCTYSAAIAAGLARGRTLRDAVSTAKDYVTAAIRHTLRWRGTQALDHYALELQQVLDLD